MYLSKVNAYTLCHTLLMVNWDEVFEDANDVDRLYNKWYERYWQMLVTSVPNRTVVIRPR